MKRVLCLVFLSFILMAKGCGRQGSESMESFISGDVGSQTKDNATLATTGQTASEHVAVSDNKQQDGVQLIEIIGEGDAARLGVSDTLVWVIDDIIIPPEEKTVNKLNDLLVKEYGCDFAVEIHRYPATLPKVGQTLSAADNKYVKALSTLMTEGQKADILYSSGTGCYTYMTETGLYEPLDEYLMGDMGQKLKAVYPEELWNMVERDGSIYAVNSDTEPGVRYLLGCNSVMAERYGITLPDEGYSFYDIEEVLMKLEQTYGTDVFKEVCPVVIDSVDSLYSLEDYCFEDTLGIGVFFKKDADNKWYALNPATDEGIIKLMTQLKKYSDRGWIKNLRKLSYDDKKDGKFLFFVSIMKGTGLVDDRFTIQISESGKKTEYITHELELGKVHYTPYSRGDGGMTGIASWSDDKENAFKFLTLLHTEAKLSNLLMFGVEGEDWRYDAEAKQIKKLPSGEVWTGNSNVTGLTNPNLVPQIRIDPEDKTTFCKETATQHEKSPFMLYDIDISGYAEKMDKISDIYYDYMDFILTEGCTDVEVTMKDMAAKLEAAGINEIIDDINRQMGRK